MGLALPPQQLLEEGEEEGFHQPEVWDVLDAEGRLAWRVWTYGTDNGTIARADTTEIVDRMSQGGIDITRKRGEGCTDTLIEELVGAASRMPREEIFEGSCLRFFR